MANQNVVPELRFPEFNDNWHSKRFGDLYSFKSTNSLSRDNLNYENGEAKNIHYGDIHTKFNAQFDILKELVPFVNPNIDLSKISEENYLQEGDLVIADASEDYADIGKSIEITNLNNEKVLAGLHTFLARRKTEELSVGFSAFLMKTYKIRLDLMRIAQGTKVLSLSSGRLSDIKLHYPSQNEQSKIALFISAVDKQIQLLEKEKALLEEYKKGITQKIFNQEIRFKDENGNDFPDWEIKTLGDCCDVAKSGGTPLSTNKDFYNGNIPFLSISDMTSQGKYLFHTSNNISEQGLQNSASWIVPVDSIIYSMYASIGFVSINKIPLATSQAVLNLIVKNIYDVEYFYYCLVNMQNKLAKYIGTGTQGNLNAQSVKSFEVKLPSKAEQEKISSYLSSIDNFLSNISEQLDKNADFKKGLLQKMFV